MNQTFDKLYARDSYGKILEWDIEVQMNGTSVDIKSSYGEFKGAKAITWQRGIKGKNLDRANETNPFEQAILQSKSKIALKKKKGYVTLVDLGISKEENNTDNILILLEAYLPTDRTDAAGDVKPMKAQQYYRTKKDWVDPTGVLWDDRKYYYAANPYVTKETGSVITKFPCMGQPKINGVRVTVRMSNNKVVIKSKEGTIYQVAHIEDFLNLNNDIFVYDLIEQDIVLDGELYIHGELLQDINSAVKKPNLNTPRIVLVLFDIAIADMNNLARWQLIKEHIKPKLDAHLNRPVQLIEAVQILDDKGAQTITDRWIKQGYEGSIFRQFNEEYAFGKRPQGMTKLKRVIDSEFTITNVIPQEKDPTKGNFVCITKEGARFDVTPKGNDEFKRDVLLNKEYYIGKPLTCVFYEWTKDKKPLHIINNIVRDYE